MQDSLLLKSRLACRALFICALLAFATATSAGGSDKQLWWGDALLQARQGHYELIDHDPLVELLHGANPPLLVDTRADYEYERGHIPGAVHFEFDLGDTMVLSEDKRRHLLELLGPDKERPIVFYCRSFR